ncbi:MAG: Gfo/Idh/MocA family oxidoreductase [Chloroflexi bacterium]|nr:Gfo/Idh/MocA family oxidoreductase [Chloroflexota bacterium]
MTHSDGAGLTLGLCVLGCGDFAATFARSIMELRGEIDLYFASRDLSKARDYTARFNGIDAFGDYAAAAAAPRVDAVYVCTPHHLHLEHVALAASEGKHALVEKPIAATLDDAQAMIRLADSAGVTLMVAENWRFHPAMLETKRLVEAGRLGQVRLIQLQEQYPFQPTGWRTRAEFNGGGVLIDGGIHKVSALSHLGGRPSRIYAHEVPSAQPGLEGEDGVVVMTQTDDGVVGIINHSWCVAPIRPHSWVSISGTTASLYFERGQPQLKLVDADSETLVHLDNYPGGFVPMVREFHSSIREGRQPSMSGAEGAADLALVLAAYESMESGRPVIFG